MHLVKTMPRPEPFQLLADERVIVRLGALKYAIETLDEQPHNCASFDELRAVAQEPCRHKPEGFTEHHVLLKATDLLDQAAGHLRRLLVGAENEMGDRLTSFWKKVTATLLQVEVFKAQGAAEPRFDEGAELAKCRKVWMARQGGGGVFADYWQGWRDRAKEAHQ